MATKRYDWPKIRDEYVTGDDTVTLEILAARHGPVYETVARRSSKEGWVAQRQMYRDESSRKTRERLLAREVNTRVRHQQTAQQMQKAALRRMATMIPEELSPSEVRMYLRDAIDIERKALGLPDAVRIEVEHELNGAIDALERELEPELFRRVLAVLARSAGE